ncbi:hypothetical protein ABIA16_002409 [Sinorhizobium fredii]
MSRKQNDEWAVPRARYVTLRPAKLTAAVHPDRYRQFVREGRASSAYLLERYTASRRRATLVACLIDLEERLTDAAIGLADKLIGNAFSRTHLAGNQRYALNNNEGPVFAGPSLLTRLCGACPRHAPLLHSAASA